MAFSASGFFYSTLRDQLANITAADYDSDALKVALFTNSITTPNFDTNTAYGVAPFNANEVTGTGYTAGGNALTSPSFAIAGKVTFTGANTAWTSATFSAVRGCLLYDSTIASPVANPALVAVTFGSDFQVTSGTFTIQWNAGGIWTIT